MKTFASVLLVAVLCSGGCALTTAKPSTQPVLPASETLLLVTSLSALQTAAITLGPVDGIPAADTTAVVAVVSAAIQVIQASQTGWVSAVDILLNKIPTVVSASTAATLAPYLDAIQVVISSLYGQGVV